MSSSLNGATRLGLDVTSGGELLAASRAGIGLSASCSPGRVTDVELTKAAGLRAVTVESAGELARLERAGAEAERVVPILLHVAVDGVAETTPSLGRLRRGGGSMVQDR